MKSLKSIVAIAMIGGGFLFAVPAFAAAVSVVGPNGVSTGVGGDLRVDVVVDTQGADINAVQGNVAFPPALFSVAEIDDGNAVTNFWIDQPTLDSSGTISFSGIVPGGYHGGSGALFSIIFKAKTAGDGTIGIQDLSILLNDGNGTPVPATAVPLWVTVVASPALSIAASSHAQVPPNPFTPEVAHSPDLFGGRWFVSFLAQDKAAGIDHYEIMETRSPIFKLFSRWTMAQSPYVLRDQTLKSYIFVKAVGADGAQRIAVVPPGNPLPWYENDDDRFIAVIVILLFCGFTIFIARGMSRKNHHICQ